MNDGSVKNSSDFQRDLKHAQTIVERILEKGVDIAPLYDDWVVLGFAFSNLGEEGRSLFHELSKLHGDYDADTCDQQYSNCLMAAKRRAEGGGCKDTMVSIASFFKMAEDCGVDISLPEELKGKPGRPRKEGKEKEEKEPAAVKARRAILSEYMLRYNCITNMIEFRKHEDGDSEGWKRMDDREFDTLYAGIKLQGIYIGAGDVRSLISSIEMAPTYNPFVEYFEGLQQWDQQTDYIEQVFDFIDFESEEDREFCMPLLKKWFINAVAMIIGKANDNQLMPVLVGPQHIGKTFFCKSLLPPELSEYVHVIMPGDDLRDKDVRIGMAQFMILIFDEFVINRNSSNQMKALVSSSEAKIRRAYGHFRETYKRFASFIGTSNEERYIDQPEGSRRYLSIKAKGTKHIHGNIPYEGAYAQAYWVVQNMDETAYKTTPEDSAAISKRNKEHTVPSLCETIIPLYYRKPLPHEPGQMLLASEIMFRLMHYHSSEINAVNVGKAMKQLGFEPKRTNSGFRYYVKEVSPEERENIAREEGIAYKKSIEDAQKEEEEKARLKAEEEAKAQQQELDFEASSECPF